MADGHARARGAVAARECGGAERRVADRWERLRACGRGRRGALARAAGPWPTDAGGRDPAGTGRGRVRPRGGGIRQATGAGGGLRRLRGGRRRRPGRGRIGAGAGAAVGKVLGRDRATEGGVGYAATRLAGGETLAVIAVANAAGDVIGEDGEVLGGPHGDRGELLRSAELMPDMPQLPGWAMRPGQNTTLVCVCTDAALDKRGCGIVARIASAGIARAVDPAFTPLDGDVVFCLASGGRPPAGPGLPPRGRSRFWARSPRPSRRRRSGTRCARRRERCPAIRGGPELSLRAPNCRTPAATALWALLIATAAPGSTPARSRASGRSGCGVRHARVGGRLGRGGVVLLGSATT